MTQWIIEPIAPEITHGFTEDADGRFTVPIITPEWRNETYVECLEDDRFITDEETALEVSVEDGMILIKRWEQDSRDVDDLHARVASFVDIEAEDARWLIRALAGAVEHLEHAKGRP